MEINSNNYPLPISSPIAEGGLPSPNLTEPNTASPKNLISDSNANSNKAKELSITEYSNKELKSMKKRCRTVMTPSQSRILRKVLEQTAFPSTEIRENLARILGMKPRTVQIWFQNQRQKSRQGRGSMSSDDLSMSGSPDSGTDYEMGNPSCASLNSTISNISTGASGAGVVTSSSPASSSYYDCSPSPSNSAVSSTSASPNSSTSPNFSALTAAAFALSNTPLPPLDPSQQQQANASGPNANNFYQQQQIYLQQQQQQQQQQHQRYSTFHGAVYKSTPGCMPAPSINSYRGNTAAAINAKRIAAALHTGGSQVMPHFLPGSAQPNPLFLPNQPQKIPLDNNLNNNSNNNINTSGPLDILASAVSNFRPNGYNYYGLTQASRVVNTVPTNRLAPIRTPSPPSMTAISPPLSSSSTSPSNFGVAAADNLTKLPSLKALAQVASIGDDAEKMHKRSKSLVMGYSVAVNEIQTLQQASPKRRYSSSVAERSTNSSAPNSSSATRRPW